MRRSYRAFARAIALAIVLAASLLTWPGSAPAQEIAPAAFAIIDVQKILRESEAVKALTGKMEERRTRYQSELRKKEEELRNSHQELARQRTVLTAEVFAEKRKELEEQVAALQRAAQERKRGLDQAFGKGMSQVQHELAEIAKEIAEERGLDLILSKATVVIVKPKLDITDDALTRLNERLPEVSLPADEN